MLSYFSNKGRYLSSKIVYCNILFRLIVGDIFVRDIIFYNSKIKILPCSNGVNKVVPPGKP